MSASVKAYFALKMIGDAVDAPHMERAREAIRARGGAARANVFTRIMLALFGFSPLARRAGDAGRDHAAAALVSVPSRQDFLLEPHRHRAAAGADGAQAEGAQSQGRRHRRAFPRAAAERSGWRRRRRSRSASLVPVLPRRRQSLLRCVEPLFPEAAAATRDRSRRRLGSASGSTARTGSARSSRPWPTA